MVPDAPASLNAPTNLVLDDEFTNGPLNNSLWSPIWFQNGGDANGTSMEQSNVAIDGNGLEVTDAANGTGGLISSNPDDGVAGHTGFQIAPSAGKPVYVEFKADMPAAADGQIANWPGLWLDGQDWPMDGEIDVMEGLSGNAAYHIHYGTNNSAQGASVNTSPGEHTYAVLWTTTSLTFVYDGVNVGTLYEALDDPMYLVIENSIYASAAQLLPATMTVQYVRVWQ
jgi:hypothetical protein